MPSPSRKSAARRTFGISLFPCRPEARACRPGGQSADDARRANSPPCVVTTLSKSLLHIRQQNYKSKGRGPPPPCVHALKRCWRVSSTYICTPRYVCEQRQETRRFIGIPHSNSRPAPAMKKHIPDQMSGCMAFPVWLHKFFTLPCWNGNLAGSFISSANTAFRNAVSISQKTFGIPPQCAGSLPISPGIHCHK